MAGSCCVDEEGQLLRFHVRPRFQQRSVALLRLALGELEATRMMVASLDPGYLSPALDVASSVEPHTLLFAPLSEPEGPGLDDLGLPSSAISSASSTSRPRKSACPGTSWSTTCASGSSARRCWLFEQGAQLLCVGELRRDQQQAGIAQLGLIVRGRERGKGIGSRMLSSLVTRSRAQGLTPHCSTEVTNLGARRVIERAGFRAGHRLLRVGFEL